MLISKIYKQHIQLNLQETQVQSLDQEEPLDKKMTTQSSILAWEIPWTKEHGGLQSMRSQRVGHNWVTKLTYLPTYKQLIQLNIRIPKSPIKTWGKVLNRQSSKEDIQLANKHMKRYSTLLSIRKTQIKTTMRYHLTPVRMAIIKKYRNNKCWRVCGEKETLLHCWWECKLIQPLWKMVWRFL